MTVQAPLLRVVEGHEMSSWEAQLLERFREGETRALDFVYSQYVDVVTRIAHAVLRACSAGSARGQGELAAALADVVQEVFVKAFDPEARRRFDGMRPYRPYLARIARNVAVDHWREMRRYIPSDLDVLVTRLSLEVNCENGSSGHDSADSQTVEVIDRYIASLDQESRRIHEALYVKGLSQREAARMLRVGRQVVRSKEAKLRRGLRRELSRMEPTIGRSPPSVISGERPATCGGRLREISHVATAAVAPQLTGTVGTRQL